MPRNIRDRRINHSFETFKLSIHNQSLSEYFKLDNIKIDFVRENEHAFTLSIHYLNKCPLLTLNLPSDILHYIKDFLRIEFKMNASIYYPPDYPWRSPIWSICSYKTTLQKIISKCACVDFYNESYAISWSVLPVIEHDILHYLVWLMD